MTISQGDTKSIETEIENATRMNIVIEFKSIRDIESVVLQIQQNPVFQSSCDMLVALVSFIMNEKCTMLNIYELDCLLIKRQKFPLFCLLNANANIPYHNDSAILEFTSTMPSFPKSKTTNRSGFFGLNISVVFFVLLLISGLACELVMYR